MEVDWAGTRMEYRCGAEGSVKKASLFVACLPYSGYCYAEANLPKTAKNPVINRVFQLYVKVHYYVLEPARGLEPPTC